MTEILKETMPFVTLLLIALAACACLPLQVSAGVAECTIEGRVASDLHVIKDAMQLYRMDTGKWPDSMKDLMERPGELEGWGGPYLARRPMDYWDREYLLFKNKAGIRAGTYGADGLPGGEEDYFIDIETGTIYCTRTEVSNELPGFIKWGWLLSTAAALALAVLLWRERRTSRRHSRLSTPEIS
jgi:general secretion pathway protein G